jgi:uncharacterized protein (TIGR01777 family)
MKIVITAASGFIGSHLSQYFAKLGHELVLLSRRPTGPSGHYWDPEKKQLDASLLEGADCVINLAGENILGRWSEQKKQRIRESRYISTQFLCDTILNLKNPPKLYIGASAVGYYGDKGKEMVDETAPPGEGFLPEVCTYWERIPQNLSTKGIRIVLTRFGIVLGEEGALKQIAKAFRAGMGGVLGNGQQMMSWIAIDDLCEGMNHLIQRGEIRGPVNFTAPEMLSNQEFTKIIGKLLNRPTMVPIPKFALTMFFGEGVEMFLTSIAAKPQKLLDSGYRFLYPTIEGALKKYL